MTTQEKKQEQHQKRDYLLRFGLGRVRVYLYSRWRGWQHIKPSGQSVYHLGYATVLVENRDVADED